MYRERQTERDEDTYVVVLATSFMLRSGSALSGPRRMQGAKTMAREFGVIRLLFSSLDTLQETIVYYCKCFYCTSHAINTDSNILCCDAKRK